MNKNILGIAIREIRKSKHLTQSKLSELTGFKQNTISNHENGNRTIDEVDVQIYAKALNVEPQYIFNYMYSSTKDNLTTSTILSIYNQLTKTRQGNVLTYAQEQLREQETTIVDFPSQIEEESVVYLYGSISAGTGEYLEDEKIEQISVKGRVPIHDIALRVNGDSMMPLFKDREIIYIKKTSDVQNGQIGAFIINGEAYLKKLYLEDNQMRLVSLNKEYNDIVVNEEDAIEVVGKVIL